MSYLQNIFTNNIDKNKIKIIFELGSRDLKDAYKLYKYYNSKVYAFECNTDCLIECDKMYEIFDMNTKNNIFLIKNAISEVNGKVSFYPFDLKKYNNMGSSSMLKIDFSMRNKSDPDYNRENPQTEIVVDGIRLDTFLKNNNIHQIDLLCIDLQGYELNALKSLGENIKNVKYIITECSIQNTYIGGALFIELNKYLESYNFKYICSNKFSYNFPDLTIKGFSEFDALFINKNN